MDDPQQFKYGGQAAAPVFREILDRMAERRIAGDWGAPPADSMPATTVAGSRPAARPATAAASIKAASASIRMPGKAGSAASSAKAVASAREEGVRRPEPGAVPTMPDLRGAALRDAMLRLRALGLEADYSGEGRVRDQVPAAGAPVRRGDRARLVLGWSG
jgi:hypothetical protein